jgi:glyoxylase-like metal-dependent hydrolase (beta-lactamase superfamily II)
MNASQAPVVPPLHASADAPREGVPDARRGSAPEGAGDGAPARPPVLDYPHPAPPPPGATIEVAPGVWWLRMPLPFALDHINLWLIRDAGGHVLVDTGYGDAATRALWDVHRATTLRGQPLRRIVVTHYHPDHLGNAAQLASQDGIAVEMTATEYLAAHAVHGNHAGSGVDDYCRHFAAHGMAAADVAALHARGNRYRAGAPELPQSYRRILGGDELTLGERRFTVIPGYGHSPEHAALFAAAPAPLLISGDMLLPRISTNVAVGPADPDGDPLARFLASLAPFEALPSETLVLPSHGLPFRGAARRVAQLRAHHDERLTELAAHLARSAVPLCAADVLPVLFRRTLDQQQRFFAMGEAIAHLNYLWHAERVERLRDAGGAIRYRATRAA